MKTNINIKSIILFLVFSIFVSLFLYRSTINAYFFQDDWFTLRISQVKNLSEFYQFFIPRNDIIYYRPLGMQVPFFILRLLFGLNPLPFHILTIVTHAVNIVLVYLLIRLIRKDSFTACLSSFLYAVSAIHYIPMFWSSTYAFILGPTYAVASLIFFILSFRKKENLFYCLSLVSFFIGLFVNEMLTVLPIILLLTQFYFNKLNIKRLLPFFLTVFILLTWRFYIFPPPVRDAYQLGIGKELLNNIKAYILWSFNWPEEMKAQFITFFNINPQFIREFSWYFWPFIITFLTSIILMFLIPLFLIFSKGYHLGKLLIYSSLWFITGLLPVIFFTQHSFSYYLPISIIGLLLLLSSMFKYLFDLIHKTSKELAFILIMILLINWSYCTYITIDFNAKIHWAPRRAELSKTLVTEIEKNYPRSLKKVIPVSGSSENRLALNNQDALKVIYNDESIVTAYEYPQTNSK
ncbi:hypothetical protein HY029_03510 [Candidatus Gottesmanbacteria bacterium]|nr:hypothetical protein [Candidatus Gottesmanbacteria bacterium]